MFRLSGPGHVLRLTGTIAWYFTSTSMKKVKVKYQPKLNWTIGKQKYGKSKSLAINISGIVFKKMKPLRGITSPSSPPTSPPGRPQLLLPPQAPPCQVPNTSPLALFLRSFKMGWAHSSCHPPAPYLGLKGGTTNKHDNNENRRLTSQYNSGI